MSIKVLLAIDEFEGPDGGTETQFWHLLTGLKSQGVETGVLLLKPSQYLESHFPEVPRRVLNISRLMSPDAFFGAWSAMRWAKKSGYDLVHTFLNDTSILLPWAAKLAGLPILLSRRDQGYWYTRRNLRALKLNRGLVTGVTANSNAVREAVVRHEGYAKSKVTVIYNGIAEAPVTDSSINTRNKLLLPLNAMVFSIVANLRPLKRIDDALRAFAIVIKEIPSSMLLIAGDDMEGRTGESHRKELETLATELGITESVRFLGFVPETDAIVNASDICLLCSETEGLSNSIMQYMRAAKPVIASNVGGNVELVEDGVCGALVDVGDVLGMADSMTELATDPERARRMGEAGRSRVTSRFGIERMLRQHAELYRATAQ